MRFSYATSDFDQAAIWAEDVEKTVSFLALTSSAGNVIRWSIVGHVLTMKHKSDYPLTGEVCQPAR